ncbi:MAG: FKBP family peptidyl-prolyl cis-trans isomerase, partial [Actinomyces urogenitalis DORA_12]
MTPEDDTQPMTRRCRRELERAREAARSGQVSQASASEPAAVTGAQRAIGATLGRPRPRGRAAVALAVVAALAVVVVPLVLFLGGAGPSSSPAATAVPAVTVSGDAPLEEVMEVAGRTGAVPVVSLKGHLSAPSR